MSSLEELFCEIDDFCKCVEVQWRKKRLNSEKKQRLRAKSLCLREIMTILIAFHQNNSRNFQHFYLKQVQQQWGGAFRELPS